jgi:hypothetical protein
MNRDIDALDSVVVPDLITPTQYFDSRRRDHRDDPVRRLMMAVLQDAIRCYRDGANSRSALKRKNFVEVNEWFCDDLGNGPFSFLVVCEILEIVPEYLRLGLAQLRKGGKLKIGRRSPILSAMSTRSLAFSPRSSKTIRSVRTASINEQIPRQSSSVGSKKYS